MKFLSFWVMVMKTANKPLGPKPKPKHFGKTHYQHYRSEVRGYDMLIYHYTVYKWHMPEQLDKNYVGEFVHVWTKEKSFTSPIIIDIEKFRKEWSYE